jgi:beta-lactamase regulating signal transducer with metallopeptidase domain
MMNSLDMLAAGWCGVAWPLLLVFTAAMLVVAALRKPCRRAFDAGRAFLLWLVPPVAMLASVLPHAAVPASTLPPIILSIATLPEATAFGVNASSAGDLRLWIAVLWLAGAVFALSLAAHAQWRYRAKLRGAVPYGNGSRRQVLRAADPPIGPALVGAWRPCIVVPWDFDDRYDAAERKLILAHEAMHARRDDGWWCLVAQIVRAAFWFHPLAWWALPALRRDQELACDAGVLREHRGGRRSYANAMLKTQPAAFPLPVGCAWSPRHPLVERIAMLKQVQPGPVRRAGGVVLAGVVILLGAGAAYAATAPASAGRMQGGSHALKLELSVGDRAPVLRAKICLEPGDHYTIHENHPDGWLPNWGTLNGRFSIVPVPGGLLEVVTELDGGPLQRPVMPRLRTRPGQTATIEFGEDRGATPGEKSGKHTIRIDLTPGAGC